VAVDVSTKAAALARAVEMAARGARVIVAGTVAPVRRPAPIAPPPSVTWSESLTQAQTTPTRLPWSRGLSAAARTDAGPDGAEYDVRLVHPRALPRPRPSRVLRRALRRPHHQLDAVGGDPAATAVTRVHARRSVRSDTRSNPMEQAPRRSERNVEP